MAHLARVLPALEPLTNSDTDRVELVNETIVKEVLQDPGELDFGRGSSPSRTLPSGASGALTAHVWRVCVRGQVHARTSCTRRRWIVVGSSSLRCSSPGATGFPWARPRPGSSTGSKANPPQAHE